LLKILVLCGAIQALRCVDRFFPGSYQAVRKVWSRRILS
jgi:hypothetical protein